MSESLKMEGRFDPALLAQLRTRGHEIEVVADYDEIVGHAGALSCDGHGGFEGGYDPRSDGAVATPRTISA
jgi:gamma-glutamyltranspeptidase/glutathione hydrolase